jgi:hypothetical protein
MPIDYALYYVLLFATACICLLRYRQLSLADKMILVLLIFTIIQEVASYVMILFHRNNIWLSHIYSPIELALLSLYFNYSIYLFRKRNIGFIIAGLGIVLSISNTLLYQKTTTFNSFFLLLEGTIIIMYCLLSFHQILLDEEQPPHHFAHFWITVCFILYWGVTFTGWGVYASIKDQKLVLNDIFSIVVKVANYVFYTGLLLIFLCYKKLTPSGLYARH